MAESGPQRQPDEAMLDLLIKQVTEGLSPEEQRELDVLDNEIASAYARDLEHAAAAISVAGSGGSEPLPRALRARIEAQLQAAATAMATSAGTAVPVVSGVSGGGREISSTVRAIGSAPPRARLSSTAGWWAAAACLVVAVLLRWPLGHGPGAAPTPAQQREALLAIPGAERIQLETTAEPAAAGAKVDVVWDPRSQRGFVRFVGLKPNDPAQHQYQLWIFDGDRDPRYPVDAGVFNVPPNTDEVVVPMRAALAVHAAKAFAVTIEQPGGVVVSGREHVVAIGKVG
jgi:anti-sigma-K factor RskA